MLLTQFADVTATFSHKSGWILYLKDMPMCELVERLVSLKTPSEVLEDATRKVEPMKFKSILTEKGINRGQCQLVFFWNRRSRQALVPKKSTPRA